MDDNFWSKVENKTSVNRETILSLARKLSNGNMKDRDTINEIIDTLSNITKKKVSDDKRERIIKRIVNDDVPSNVDKLFK